MRLALTTWLQHWADVDDATAGVSPNLLFEWAIPILSGQGIAGWKHLDVGVQCWVLVALKEGLAAADMPVLHQHALAVLALCHNLLKSEATSVHLIAPVMGLVSEVSISSRHQPHCMHALLHAQAYSYVGKGNFFMLSSLPVVLCAKATPDYSSALESVVSVHLHYISFRTNEHAHLAVLVGLSPSALSEGNFSWPGGFTGGMVA